MYPKLFSTRSHALPPYHVWEGTTLNHSTIYMYQWKLAEVVCILVELWWICFCHLWFKCVYFDMILEMSRWKLERERWHFQRKNIEHFGMNLNKTLFRKMSDYSWRKHAFYLRHQIAKNVTGQHSITQTVSTHLQL